MNYYSNDTIIKIGEHKIKSLDGIELVPSGAFYKLFSEPLNINLSAVTG